jgi:hypothetical protein
MVGGVFSGWTGCKMIKKLKLQIPEFHFPMLENPPENTN